MNDLKKLLVLAGIIATPWIVSACGETTGDNVQGNGSGRSGICAAICERAEECGFGSAKGCVQTCRDDDVSSSAALQVVEICADKVSCNGFQNGDLAECVGDGIAALDASTAVEEYCDTYGDWRSECTDESITSAECYWAYNAASSVYLAEMGECLGQGCQDAAECIAAVETRYDAGSSIMQLVFDRFGSGACCSAGDPCGLADDNECHCDGDFAWDDSDCSAEPGPHSCNWINDGVCDEPDLCPVGTDTSDCDDDEVDCCAADDPCDWGGDGVCHCDGDYDWDATDCAVDNDSCRYARDNVCDEPQYCDYGTDTTDCELELECCVAGDPCDWDDDDYCDCGGEFTWDDSDCGGGTGDDACRWALDEVCDEPHDCAYGTDSSDCAGACCSASDPCGWADDQVCDCDGAFAWDAVDCSAR